MGPSKIFARISNTVAHESSEPMIYKDWKRNYLKRNTLQTPLGTSFLEVSGIHCKKNHGRGSTEK